jgi:putative oxidoreductase
MKRSSSRGFQPPCPSGATNEENGAGFAQNDLHASIQGATMSHDRSPSIDRPAVDYSLLILRVVVGVIFALHGSQKLFGAFGGPGLSAMMQPPPNGMGILGFFVTIGEFFGGLGLIVGFLTRFSAASLIVIMLGAIFMVHGKNGFFLGHGPESKLMDAGFEYNLALIGLLAPILLAGPGWYAIGRCLPLPKAKATGRPIVVLE